ncbi:MAG: tRNA dihydrouridine synthase DusB [Clostridia bacterium]|nr:tRNA dihydrouridine synthase DusB [Clostridia bacterium]
MKFEKTPIFLGPMAGNGDYAFRRICKEAGADFVVTEMISAKAVWYHDKKTKQLACIRKDERPCFLQLFGSEEQCMDYAVKELEAEVAPEGFDINMGCPAPKIFNNGEGSALLRDLDKAERLVRTVRRATNLPVSVKMRLGVEIGEDVAVEAAKRFEAAGADFLAVHGRYREQHYSGKADWYKIAPVKQAVRIPVIANGDITCAEDFKSVLEITGADGIMVARGALGDPHLFTRLAAYRDSGVMLPPQTLEERLQTALRQLDLAIADKGEKPAVLEMRKHFLWYVRGVRGAAAYKNRCCKVTTRAECVALLNEIAENNK